MCYHNSWISGAWAGEGERLSGAGWDPDWEAEMLEQGWDAGSSVWWTLSLRIPSTPQWALESAKPTGLVRVQALLGQIHLLCFYALLQLGSQAVTPRGSTMVHSASVQLVYTAMLYEGLRAGAEGEEKWGML